MGGFLGSISRYLVRDYFFQNYQTDYPWGTFVVNVVGCFLIGLILGISSTSGSISKEGVWFFSTGFCGAFTTFSTFSYENSMLLSSEKALVVILYIGLSVTVGLIFTWLGLNLAKLL